MVSAPPSPSFSSIYRPSFFRQRVELKYAFMAENPQHWPVAVVCEVLEVSRSGFYAYQRRQAVPAHRGEEIDLLERIKSIAAKTHYSYGSRRLTKQLQDEGVSCRSLQGASFDETGSGIGCATTPSCAAHYR
jgi:hypothetical protein